MILEVAILNVRPGQEAVFENAFREARRFIEASPGFGALELRRCVEISNRYLLLVRWRAIEDHTVGFRGSPDYQEWRRRLHDFYDPFPTVEHYQEAIA
ncbi:MAG: antibiotic biosynthesis monooxygenase family protein [Candidatus Acidiferrales bacterium]